MEKNICPANSVSAGQASVNMELSAVGERVFAAESIIKRRIRKVDAMCNILYFTLKSNNAPPPCAVVSLQADEVMSVSDVTQGRIEYLVKWKGWSPK